MDLIVTHINADFDALASMVAAKRLYPQARLLFPGSQERAVRKFMSLCKDIVKIETEKRCSLEGIDRLVIVDTRIPGRIGKAKSLIDNEKVKVEIYDHHPRSEKDIRADKDVFDEVGATVTMLIERIRRKKLHITPLEATIMALGVYQETGSLTYPGTTKKDVESVGFLLAQGANLTVVSSYLNLELTDKEMTLLVKLIQATESYSLKGVKVAISAIVCEEFEADLAVLAHKLLEIEKFHAVFILAKTEDRIHLIARSQIPSLDVNKITRNFKGGGHPTAASAKIKNMELFQVKEKLIRIIKAYIKPLFFACDIMVSSLPKVDPDMRVVKLKEIFAKLNLSGVPILEEGKIVGIATQDDIDKAIQQGFGHSRIKGYMKPKVITISPQTSISDIQNIMFESNIGHLFVVKGRKLLGMVSRSDVLKVICDDLVARTFSLNESKISNKISNVLKTIGALADRMNYRAFIVGGFVRDLLLGVENFDVDIVVEEDAIKFGEGLAKRVKGSLVVHRKFGTATVVMPDKFKIDIATARSETYREPAALPEVEFASIKDDLYRRDFTINAMAIRLNRKGLGVFIDFFGAERDLRMKIVRVLHDRSFVDDPTRIFRAVRFEQRYNFTIEKHTEDLIKKAVSLEMFDKTQKQRLRDELILILKEDAPLKAVLRMAELHELRFIHPKIVLDDKAIKSFGAVTDTIEWFKKEFSDKRAVDAWLLYLCALLESLIYKQIQDFCNKFVFTKTDTLRILTTKKLSPRILKTLNSKKLKPSQIYRLLQPLSYETILFIMSKVKTAKAKKRIISFFKDYNEVKLKIGGCELKKLGLLPGPAFKCILEKILYTKLDGKLESRTDELNLARKLIKMERHKSAAF